MHSPEFPYRDPGAVRFHAPGDCCGPRPRKTLAERLREHLNPPIRLTPREPKGDYERGYQDGWSAARRLPRETIR